VSKNHAEGFIIFWQGLHKRPELRPHTYLPKWAKGYREASQVINDHHGYWWRFIDDSELWVADDGLHMEVKK